ncbi:MAG TPA: cupredoxin domain-containing protein, partial [Acidobacteriaceae bacterium]|nr:cupredoxin domain-containing protein [Acidobacteriaceae bacterium]
MKLKFVLFALFVVALIPAVFTISSARAQAPRRIEVTASRFEFAPAEITVKKGEPVVIVLKSTDVAHGLSFEDLGV